MIPNIPVGRNRNGPFLRKGACIRFTCRFEDTATGCGIHQYILDFSDLFKPAVKTFSETEELYYSIPEEHLSRDVISDGFAINHFQVDKLIQLRPWAAQQLIVSWDCESIELKYSTVKILILKILSVGLCGGHSIPLQQHTRRLTSHPIAVLYLGRWSSLLSFRALGRSSYLSTKYPQSCLEQWWSIRFYKLIARRLFDEVNRPNLSLIGSVHLKGFFNKIIRIALFCNLSRKSEFCFTCCKNPIRCSHSLK